MPIHFSTLKKPQILKPRAHPSSGATWASLPVADIYEARGSNLRTRAHPFRRTSFVFCKRMIFCRSARSGANTRADDTRVLLVGSWRSSCASALAHALRACDLRENRPQSIHWSRAFLELCEKVYRQLVRAGRLLRGSKLVRKTILTDSRFRGTTELLSAPQLELKGVRAKPGRAG